ncbi:hypothetical protein Cantr_07602 [Candida viswanathii]|uniref:Uncharacterized protein n=1 Tax=Candida viswanathii TaxID=5486 RepID=A0A367Y1Q0_9ASCO|nr:hypothetical protein Cantr_07602 [Candida viswanathii]
MSGLVSKWATDESLVQEALKQDSRSQDNRKNNSLEDSKWNKPITSKGSEPLISKWANVEDDKKGEKHGNKHVEKNPPRAPREPKTPKQSRRSDYPTPPSSAENIDLTNPLAQRLDMLNLGREAGDSKGNGRHDRERHRSADRERGLRSSDSHKYSERQKPRRDLELTRDTRQHSHRDNHRIRDGHGHRRTASHDKQNDKLKQELEAKQKEQEEQKTQELLKQIEQWESQDIDWAEME